MYRWFIRSSTYTDKHESRHQRGALVPKSKKFIKVDECLVIKLGFLNIALVGME